MKNIVFIILCCFVGCNTNPLRNYSATRLNDSALSVTNHFKDTSKFTHAIYLLNMAIERDSTIFEVYKNKFFFEVSLGNYVSAIQTNKKLISFRPDSADLYLQDGIFSQYLLDTLQAKNSFVKATLLYKATMDTLKTNSPYFFYDWKMWAYSMIMTGHEDIIHEFLKKNCTNGIDSAIYNPQMLGKTKQALVDTINKRLAKRQFIL